MTTHSGPAPPAGSGQAEYPTAEVLAAIAAGCLVVTLLLITAAVLLARGDVSAAADFGREEDKALLLAGLGAGGSVFLVAFGAAWYLVATASGPPTVFDLLGLGAGLVSAAAIFALSLAVGLALANGDQLAGAVAAILADASRAEAASAASGAGVSPAFPSTEAVQQIVRPPDATQLGTTIWVIGRGLLFLAGAGCAALVSLFSLGLRRRHSDLLPPTISGLGAFALPLILLQFFVVFGSESFVFVMPALVVTSVWLAASVRALLARAEAALGANATM